MQLLSLGACYNVGCISRYLKFKCGIQLSNNTHKMETGKETEPYCSQRSLSLWTRMPKSCDLCLHRCTAVVRQKVVLKMNQTRPWVGTLWSPFFPAVIPTALSPSRVTQSYRNVLSPSRRRNQSTRVSANLAADRSDLNAQVTTEGGMQGRQR